jgi:hypothetical protein
MDRTRIVVLHAVLHHGWKSWILDLLLVYSIMCSIFIILAEPFSLLFMLLNATSQQPVTIYHFVWTKRTASSAPDEYSGTTCSNLSHVVVTDLQTNDCRLHLCQVFYLLLYSLLTHCYSYVQSNMQDIYPLLKPVKFYWRKFLIHLY